MSQTPTPSTSSTSTSNYQTIFDNALEAYKKTKKDLVSHPLLATLETCHSTDAIVNLLREHIYEFNQSRTEAKLTKWLNPIVNVLSAFSATIGGGVSLVYSPAGVIFTGIAVLLSACQAVSALEDALANIFESIENFFIRLETYFEVPPTSKGMTDIIVKIMAEVLSILGLATKEIKQSRARKYVKKLVGRADIEDALARLDRLTQEEVRMAAAQTLNATHGVDNKVQAVYRKVQGVGDKVQCVDDKLQRVDNRVEGVGDNVRDIGGKMDVLIDGGVELREGIQRSQIQRDLEKWLSPTDPSVNYNTASDAHHEGTGLWFTESDDFKNWKASGSLLWIYGKPGSGKSVLSSSIIQDVECKSNTGSAYIAYFFFDFKDIGKQDAHALLSSLVSQLSHQSDSFFAILFRYYSTHQSGSRKPSDRALTQCLEDMLRAPRQVPIYLIVDALDESPNTTGMPSSRDRVLTLIEKLVKLNLPNLHLCITSRPEVDIRTSLEPLATSWMSLPDQSGQKRDITDFVKSVVYLDRNMRRWREEDREVVIKTLSERADGMFRWVFCQLETLRHCLPPSVLCILMELPDTLDETYERILQEIPKSNRVHAHRLLQCLTVAIRPLRVEELAEVIAIDFDATGGIPKLKEALRWENQEQAVLSACSSLITIVEDDDFRRVVQFSHFSVKEFLTSDRLATSNINVSRYHHIRLEPAHIVMAQACLSVLLRLDSNFDRYNNVRKFPLARYAAEYFGNHAEVESVLSHILGGVDDLLDADKPHFAAWLSVRRGNLRGHPTGPEATPLYYVAEFGFRGMVQYLISKRPEDLNPQGIYGTPLHAALENGHADVAQLLVRHCVDVDIRNAHALTPLHLAGHMGLLEVARMLIERNADINARDNDGRTPLYRTVRSKAIAGEDRCFDVARFLLSHGANPDARDKDRSTLLHAASYGGNVKVVQLLLELGANIDARDMSGQTPLHKVVDRWEDDMADHYFDAIRLLLERGADVHAQDNDNSTPLHAASYSGSVTAAQLLLEHGANINMRNKRGQTPLHRALDNLRDDLPDRYFDAIPFLLERGADIDAQDNDHSTALHAASYSGSVKAAKLLLEHGANVDVRNKRGQTPLHRVVDGWEDNMTDHYFDVMRLLLERGADVHAQDNDDSTPLHAASYSGSVKAAQLFLDHGANINVRDKKGRTPLYRALDDLQDDFMDHYFDAILLLLECGADVHAQDSDDSTPLHAASSSGSVKAAQLLLDHGANINVRNKRGQTPLHRIFRNWNDDTEEDIHDDPDDPMPDHYFDTMQFLVERGADVRAQDNDNSTPLHAASYTGSVKAVRLLLEYGANIDMRNKRGQTPLHRALDNLRDDFEDHYFDAIQLLLERGADIDAQDNDHSTPVLVASRNGCVEAARALLERGANIHLQDNEGKTPYQIASMEGHEELRWLLWEHWEGEKRV